MVVIITTTVQSEHIATNFVSSNPANSEVDSIQHYVIKYVNHLRQVGGFSLDTPVSSVNKTDHHNTTEILLKVAFKTIAITITLFSDNV